MRVVAVTVLLAGVLACQADLPEGVFGCETAADCPAGWACGDDGLCWESASVRGDGSSLDGGDPMPTGDERPPADPLPGDDAPRCDDGLHNGDETDIDCGSVCPNRCGAGRSCETREDCVTDLCVDSTCEIPPEDCFNGVDDDDDQLIDCADGDCILFGLCVQSVAPPFSGYYRIRSDAFGSTTEVPCRSGNPATRYVASPRDVGTCEPCGCDAWGGGACGAAELYCDPNGGCNSWNHVPLSGNECDYRPFAGETNMECYVQPGAVTNPGTCPPTGGSFIASDMWDEIVDVCGGEKFGGGCGVGACAPLPESGYDSSICVIAAGDHACPNGFPTRSLVHTSGTDNRACSACVCDASATCSGASFHVNDGTSCSYSDPHIDHFTATTCTNVGWINDAGSGTWSVRRNRSDTASGSCTPAGGEPIGSIEPAGTHTVCCL